MRIVDHGSAGWGHINFDHFRFHDEQPPTIGKLRPTPARPTTIRYAGLPAEEAAQRDETAATGFR